MFNSFSRRGFQYLQLKRIWLPVLVALAVTISGMAVCIPETVKAGTVADIDAPEVITYYTADDGAELPADMTQFILTFNEKVWGQPNKEIHIFETEGDNCICDLSVAGKAANSSNMVMLDLPETFKFKFNTAYHITIDRGAFKDEAGNEYAGIDDSTTWNFSTQADTMIPNAPANLRLVSKTGTGVSLEWDESTDNDGVDYYEVHMYRMGSGEGFAVGASSSVNSCNLTGLSPETTYRFRVHAYDFSGNRSWCSNEVEVNIGSGDATYNYGNTVPGSDINLDTGIITGQPVGLSSSLVLQAQAGAGYVKLDWNAITHSGGVSGYYIYRATSPGGQTELPLTDFWINDITYNDTKVTAGTTYYYIVKPVYGDSSIGEGSNEVFAAPEGGAVIINMTIGDPMMLVNGISKEIDPGQGTAPVLTEGRTFLPVRAVIEEMGGTIGWEGTESKVIIQLNEKTLELWIGSTVMRVNGVEQTLDVAPYISDTGRTMLPLRFVGESLGCVMSWDGNTSTATILYDLGNASGNDISNGTGTQTGTTTPGTTTDMGTSNQQQGSSPWTGVWKIDMGMLILTQTGNSVTGTYGEWDDNYVINGTANGSKLTGTLDYYDQPGTFEFNISANGSIGGWCRPDGYEDWEDSIEFSGVKTSDSFGSPGTAWGGVWYTDFGPMVLTQNGSSVSGVYRPYTDVSVFQIEGTVSGDTFSGRIREDEFEGTFEFELESGGEVFTGRYAYDGDETVWTNWSGIKKK